MIIGKGSIASMLNDREYFLFFASGVSDSSGEVLCTEFLREHDALLQFAGDDRCLVYFSTISKFHKMSPYIVHKQKMETFVRLWFPNYIILNLGNVWGCTNPNTFINKMKYWDRQGKYFEVRHEYKYMISADQLRFATDNLSPLGKHELSIFGELLTVAECLRR